ncbi:hypothetical protein DFH09DRAFT_1111750 [Mycena vulgaris]|nr:hypothetical protein DFH09DRAFT_1111750 [Mycena vulgaris]
MPNPDTQLLRTSIRPPSKRRHVDEMGVRVWHYQPVASSGLDGQESQYQRPWHFQPVGSATEREVSRSERRRERAERVVERIREVPVQVRVEVPVERVREVPVEVRVEVPIERVREVPVEVRVEVPVEHPETGWDDETDPKISVFDSSTGQTIEKTVACTARILDLVHTTDQSEDWSALHLFGDDTLSVNHMFLEVGKGKKRKRNRHSFTIIVLQGAIRVVLNEKTPNETTLVLAPGGVCLIPRNNWYMFENISERRCKFIRSPTQLGVFLKSTMGRKKSESTKWDTSRGSSQTKRTSQTAQVPSQARRRSTTARPIEDENIEPHNPAADLTYKSGRPRRRNAGQGGVVARAERVGDAIWTNPSPNKRTLRPNWDVEDEPHSKKAKLGTTTNIKVDDRPLERPPQPVRQIPRSLNFDQDDDEDDDGNKNMLLNPSKYPERIQEEDEDVAQYEEVDFDFNDHFEGGVDEDVEQYVEDPKGKRKETWENSEQLKIHGTTDERNLLQNTAQQIYDNPAPRIDTEGVSQLLALFQGKSPHERLGIMQTLGNVLGIDLRAEPVVIGRPSGKDGAAAPREFPPQPTNGNKNTTSNVQAGSAGVPRQDPPKDTRHHQRPASSALQETQSNKPASSALQETQSNKPAGSTRQGTFLPANNGGVIRPGVNPGRNDGVAAPRDFPPRPTNRRSNNTSSNGKIVTNSRPHLKSRQTAQVHPVKKVLAAISGPPATLALTRDKMPAATRGPSMALAKMRVKKVLGGPLAALAKMRDKILTVIRGPPASDLLAHHPLKASFLVPPEHARKITSRDLQRGRGASAPREKHRDDGRDTAVTLLSGPVQSHQSSHSSRGRAPTPDEDVLQTHRSRNRAPKAPSVQRLAYHKEHQQRLGVETSDRDNNSPERSHDGSNDGSDEEEEESKRKSRTANVPKPQNMCFYEGDYQTGLLTAKRNQRLFVFRHNMFPGRKTHMPLCHDMVLKALNQYEEETNQILDDEIYFTHSQAMDELVWNEVACFRGKGKDVARIVADRYYHKAFFPHDAFAFGGYGQEEFEQRSATRVEHLLEGSRFVQYKEPKKPRLNVTHPAIRDVLDGWAYGGGSKPATDPLFESFPRTLNSVEVEDVAAAMTLLKNAIDERANGYFKAISCTADRYQVYYQDAIQTCLDVLDMENTGQSRINAPRTRVFQGNNFELLEDVAEASDSDLEEDAADDQGSTDDRAPMAEASESEVAADDQDSTDDRAPKGNGGDDRRNMDGRRRKQQRGRRKRH